MSNRNFGFSHQPDSNIPDRVATCFALGFIVIIFVVLIGGIYAASQLVGS